MVIVPLATPDDAGADTRTKTVQRCSYDPFAGRQCWTETVNVSHVHRCGAGLTGTYPNCYPIPPVTQPVCPAGMTGTPPNCYPPPPATTEPPPPPTTAPPPPTTQPPPTTTVYVPPTTTTTAPPQCPAGETGTPPNCQKAECRAGQTGTPPDCKKAECLAGQTGTPPNCKSGRDTTRCATGHHRFGTGCHPNHDWTKIPCGTGTWTPHSGHTAQQRPACEDDQDDDGDTTDTVESCSSYQGPLRTYERHRHPIGDSSGDSACHRLDDSHCPAGQTETGGHGSGSCADDEIGNELIRIAGLIRNGALNAARAALNKIAEENGEAALENARIREQAGKEIAEAIEKVWNETPEEWKVLVKGLAAIGGCAVVITLIVKSTAASAGAAAPGWVAWVASPSGKSTLERTCGGAIVIATAFSIASSDDSDGGDSDGPPSLTDLQEEVDELETKWRNGSFSNSEERDQLKRDLEDAQNRRDCAQGWADACAALGR